MDKQEQIKQLKREYYKNYRLNNRDKINERQKEWRKNNKDKIKRYNETFWIKKAKLMQMI